MSSTHFDTVVVGSGFGGTIVAEVLVGLVRRSENSIQEALKDLETRLDA
jgi:UDP-galactopyranose mutase